MSKIDKALLLKHVLKSDLTAIEKIYLTELVKQDVPTIEAEPVRHGKWIPQYVSSRGLSNVFECSVCTGHTYTLHKRSRCYDKYCRCCGAKMDGKCI